MADASAAAKPCHEETIYLPVWDKDLCWFLSMNLALFHKPIPEFQNYVPNVKKDFEKDKEAEEFLQKILQHYSNKTNQDNKTYGQIENLRINDKVAAFFSGSSDFQINGASAQRAEDYLLGLQKTHLFHQYITTISVGHDFMNIDAMNWDILLSLDLNTRPAERKNGLTLEEYNDRDVLNKDGKLEAVRSEKSITPLLFLVQITAGRGSSTVADSETNILENITVPAGFLWKMDPSKPMEVKEKSEELTCSLISILENTGDAHYNCAVKCSALGSSVWYFYGGGVGVTGGGKSISEMDKEIKEKITFASLHALLNHDNYSRLKKTSVLLVYEVVKTPSKSGGT